ncbi:MAG: thiol reductant ABC exporter subunit CydC [Salinisphaera sp.]|jgi:ATP-binding cassette subfamily C protein CydC|nr:thiol reductant ABC exporter subunit CydC [Salinisphaera sp.]
MKELLRLLQLFRPYWRAMLAGIGLSAAVVLTNVALLAVSGWFITAMALAGLGMGTINYFTPAAGIRALAIIRAVGRYGERLVTHDATLHGLAELRGWFYQHLEPLAPARLQFYRGGDLLSRIRADIDTLDNFYLRVLAPSVAAAFSVLLMTAFITLYSGPVALINLAGLLAAGLVLPLWAQWLGNAPGERAVSRRADLRAAVADSVRGLGELEVYQASARQAATIDRLGAELIAPQRQQARIDGLSSALSGLASRLTLWLALLVVIPLVASQQLGGADLAMIAFFVLAGFEGVAALPLAFQSLGETFAAARRIFEIVDAEPMVTDPSHEADLPAKFDIEFKQLRMRYAPDGGWALDGIDLKVAAGARVAIVGPTGSGKTSLFNVLLRFWGYQEGSLDLGGQPLTGFSGETVRSWCAVVAQQTHLFNASVRDNLLLACPDASQDALIAALRQACVYDEIAALPQGLDTLVGEIGARLSGGQARRVAIARALLKDAPILLLDEPTEGLDVTSEQAVLQALEALMIGRTTLLVTHRPQALRYVDHVVVLGRGRVLEQGKPAALLQGGQYLPSYASIN